MNYMLSVTYALRQNYISTQSCRETKIFHFFGKNTDDRDDFRCVCHDVIVSTVLYNFFVDVTLVDVVTIKNLVCS